MDSRLVCSTLLFVVLYMGQVATILADDDPVIWEFSNKERQVHGLLVQWNISEQYEVDEFSVTSQKQGSLAKTISGKINSTESEYLVDDLNSNTNYRICFDVTLVAADSDACENGACGTCLEMATIRIIRDDSLIAIIVTLGAIMGLVLIGYLCWYCAKKRLDEPEGEDEDEASESKQPILLRVPDKSNGPRRSVEFNDQDIPYIDEIINKDATVTNV